VEEFEGHHCERIHPDGAARCPLCNEIVKTNDKEGWHEHIMVNKCPGNPRLPA